MNLINHIINIIIRINILETPSDPFVVSMRREMNLYESIIAVDDDILKTCNLERTCDFWCLLFRFWGIRVARRAQLGTACGWASVRTLRPAGGTRRRLYRAVLACTSSCGPPQARGTEACPPTAHESTLLVPNSPQLGRDPKSRANVCKRRLNTAVTYFQLSTNLIKHYFRSYVFGCAGKRPRFAIWWDPLSKSKVDLQK